MDGKHDALQPGRDKKADRVGGYLEMATEIVERNGYLAHAKRQMDQVERRLVLGETIPHEEKVFSILGLHTLVRRRAYCP